MSNPAQRAHGQPSSVLLDLPSWLWGGDSNALSDAAGWKLEPSEQPGRAEVSLIDATARSPLKMVTATRVAHKGNIDSPGTFSRLKNMPPHDVYMNSVDGSALTSELNWIAQHHPSLGGALSQATITTTFSADAALESTVRGVMKDQLLPVLADATMYVMQIDPRLEYRYALPRVLLRNGDDPAALAAEVEGAGAFESSRGLLGDTMYGLSAYLTPLFLCSSPWVWGFPVPRAGAVIVFSLGEFVAGREGSPVEPLQLFHPLSAASSVPRPTVGGGALQASIYWWTKQLNSLFFEVTNPCNFASEDREFLYRRQLEGFLSVEQLFRNLQSLSAIGRDNHARRSLFFDTLDTLHGLRLLSFDEMCRYQQAEKALGEIRAALPDDVASVLLPRAERALAALRSLQDGFFLKSKLSNGKILLPNKDGVEQEVDKGNAVAWWLRVLRNAGHGFTSKDATRARDEALLTAHDGKLPTDVTDLAYLYLMRLMATPSLLRSGPLHSRN